VTLTRLSLVLCALHAAATASPDAVAAFRDGSISRSEFASWRRFLGRTGPAEGASLRDDVESLVVLRVLADQAAREGLLETSAGRAAVRQLERELAVAALRARMRAESVPSEADLRADYEAKRADYVQPRRWLLRNILLRAPAGGGADREAVRRRAAELRARAAAGEDFAALAQQYSESTTQARKGRIGWVSLERLQPKVAEAVAPLAEGGLSEVIETPEGFTILKCVGIRPAGTIPYEELRAQRESVLGVERLAKRREALLAELRGATRLEPAAAPAIDPDAPVYTYRGRDATSRPISLAEYEVFLHSRKVDPDAELTAEERERWRDELLVELGLDQEARRLGLLDTPAFKEKWAWERLRAAAHEALTVRARKESPVTAQEVATVYEANRDRFVRPEGFRLSAIELILDEDIPRAVVERARAAAEDLAAGRLTWADAPAAIDPGRERVRVRDLGWMSRKEFFHLGASAQAAAEALRPGATSGLVQESRRLMILRMEEQRPPMPLPLAEVSERIKKEITRRRSREAEANITAEILAAQRVIIAADPPAAP
jgi:parvulin-like peptidyl-prolyl isomerase